MVERQLRGKNWPLSQEDPGSGPAPPVLGDHTLMLSSDMAHIYMQSKTFTYNKNEQIFFLMLVSCFKGS